MKKFGIFLVFLVCCQNPENTDHPAFTIYPEYKQSWLDQDEAKLMWLFEEGAEIQPGRLNPIEGKKKIRSFWFPNDGSETIINKFNAQLLHFEPIDTIAISTHETQIDFTYTKDTFNMRLVQEGITTTVYRQQSEEVWKIWKMMWTDVSRRRLE